MKSNVILSVLGAGYISDCDAALVKLLEDEPGITAAVIATGDGFEVCSAQGQGQMPATRLAALASSLLALGQAALRELSMSGSGSLFIDSATGKILVVEVPRERNSVVLCVAADAHSTAGKVLWATRQCASRIGDSKN